MYFKEEEPTIYSQYNYLCYNILVHNKDVCIVVTYMYFTLVLLRVV